MANIGGTTSSDTLNGTSTADRINAGAGDDTVFGGGGADILIGGTGDDYLDGGTGADYIIGGVGNDTMVGREGIDTYAFWFKLSGDTDPVDVPEGTDETSIVSITGSEGYDTIVDFDWRLGSGQEDKLDFNGMKSNQYDYLVDSGQLSYSHADYTGDGNTDMRIEWAGGSITLSGITANKIADLDVLKAFVMFDA